MGGQRDAVARRSGDNDWVSMVSDWRVGWAGAGRWIATARYAPVLASAALAGLAAVAALASQTTAVALAGPARSVLLLVLVAVSLLTALPLGVLWPHPAAGAVAVTAADLLSFIGFQTLTVPGLIALLVALYRLGRSGPQLLPAVLVLPFVILALTFVAHPTPRVFGVLLRVLVVLAASLGPVAIWAGAVRRSRSQAVEHSAERQAIAGTCSSTPPAASERGSPGSCTTWSPTTSR